MLHSVEAKRLATIRQQELIAEASVNRTANTAKKNRVNLQGSLQASIIRGQRNTQLRTHFLKYLNKQQPVQA